MRDGARRARPDGEVVDFREVVVEHRAEIFRYARTFTRSDADAEDLAQTAVLRALGPGVALRDPDKAKSYLFRIVRNLATDQARSRARVRIEPWETLPDAVSAEPEPGAALLADDERAIPRAALAGLGDDDREVLQLRYVEELDYATVAERMHTTPQGARQRVYRAMQALRAIVRSEQLRLRDSG